MVKNLRKINRDEIYIKYEEKDKEFSLLSTSPVRVKTSAAQGYNDAISDARMYLRYYAQFIWIK
jgi:hypothetical protein